MNSKKIEKITDILTEKLGQNKVVIDNDILEKYSRDETADLSFFPDLLVRADNVDDVSIVLNICNEYGVPVIPRGAGTGVTGGAVPVVGGVVLSLENMNKIIEIDDINMVAIVEPGEGYLIILAGMGLVYGEVGEVLPEGAPIGMMGGENPETQEFLIEVEQGIATGHSETLYIEIREHGSHVDPGAWFALNGE